MLKSKWRRVWSFCTGLIFALCYAFAYAKWLLTVPCRYMFGPCFLTGIVHWHLALGIPEFQMSCIQRQLLIKIRNLIPDSLNLQYKLNRIRSLENNNKKKKQKKNKKNNNNKQTNKKKKKKNKKKKTKKKKQQQQQMFWSAVYGVMALVIFKQILFNFNRSTSLKSRNAYTWQ